MKKVEVILDINTTPEKIISAFTDINMLKDWWKVERALIEKQIGEAYTLAWNITDKGFGYISTGIIQEYDPASILTIDKFIYLILSSPYLALCH